MSVAGRRGVEHAFQNKESAILVVSPHPDDDVLGAGGMMTLASRKGDPVYSVYVTDGRPQKKESKRIIATRKKEALDALHVVGARGGFFMGLDSRTFVAGREESAVQVLADIIDAVAPRAVYAPAPLERHITHVRVLELALSALRNTRGKRPELWGYAVWGSVYGLPGTRTIDIHSVLPSKRRAVGKHKSQVRDKPYEKGMLGKNAYEGIFLDTHRKKQYAYGETFLNMQELLENRRLSLKGFCRKLFEKYLEHL